MPTIYDNIENKLFEGLVDTFENTYRTDFCVGYFNLRGWKHVMKEIENLEGDENCCRLLVGMQKPSDDIVKEALSNYDKGLLDQATALKLKRKLCREFRRQLTFGIPTDQDEKALQTLANQIKSKKVKVKLFLKYPLHAKLYLLFRSDKKSSIVGYVGSSNLTLAGLEKQGELNVDVLEQDAAKKLSEWFDDRWEERWCIDISEELIEILEESWASEQLIKPYYIYLKIAYHLAHDARMGTRDFFIPELLKKKLFEYQINAVSIAAQHLDKRGGVIIGDVVGLGKTLTAIALAKMFEETFSYETLVICPKNLVEMWDDHLHEYEVRGKAFSISKVGKNFSEETKRFRLVIIDESHNLRNRQGKRYGIIRDYIEKNEPKVILLSATPYNKSYEDISSQLRLFLPEDQDIGIYPERFIEQLGGGAEFTARYQYSPNTILAFEKSDYTDDWRQLLKLYMVRRTRTFIKNNYAQYDEKKKQHYLTFPSGEPSYFPTRVPKKVEYSFDEKDPTDIYAKLYSRDVVNKINSLHLARYGLGNFIDPAKESLASDQEKAIIANLSRAGRRLMGFSRTNLFKRLESSGYSFLLSISRHILRNYLFVHAIENGLKFPIGPQESELMNEFSEESEDEESIGLKLKHEEYEAEAKLLHERILIKESRYNWISASLFHKDLKKFLLDDCKALLEILKLGVHWKGKDDKQLNALEELIFNKHKKEKVLLFTQFSDTADYLFDQLKARGRSDMAIVTGDVEDPTHFVKRFSPISNHQKNVKNELRVLISTDVLSEGQNLQDAHVIVNYDLPWALIRLIQRAGRVDRIGQKSDQILCYSFLPQDGLERIINLRSRLRTRINENSEVVGSDEVFFDGDPVNITDLYNEKSGILDDEGDTEVDLTSTAFEIWKQAINANLELKKLIPQMPDVVFSTKERKEHLVEGEGVITFHRTMHGNDMLTWLDGTGKVVSKSLPRILKALECSIDEPPLVKLDKHHELVERAVKISEKEEKETGGNLGKQTGARYKAYMELKRYMETYEGTLFEKDEVKRAMDDIYRSPLRSTSRDLLNRKLRLGMTTEELVEEILRLRSEGKLTRMHEDDEWNSVNTSQIICSMGIKNLAE